MVKLYDILKANRMGKGPDFMTTIMGQNWNASEEVFEEYTGPVPVTIKADGSPLLVWTISGNMSQSGTPTPQNPIYPQETGELVSTGEHAGEYSIPIISGNTTTPVYLSEPIRKIGEYADIVEADGMVTRYVNKLVLSGVENWTRSQTRAGAFYITISGDVVLGAGVCDRAVNSYTLESYAYGTIFMEGHGNTKYLNVWLFDYNISLEEFKSYLAAQYANGTPVTIWYALATPTTEIISAPTIPTTAGSQTFDVDTSLKPSEVYIKYKRR